MSLEDAERTRQVRSELARRYVDSSMLEVHVIHGVVHFTGVLRPLRSHPDVDLKKEMEVITHALRGRPGVRDVIWEADVRPLVG